MVKFLTGISKDIATVKMLKLKEARNLDAGFLWWMRKSAKYEKFVEIDGKIVMNSQMPPYGSEAFRRFLKLLPRLKDGHRAPISCNISVTNRCNFSCWHCSNWGREEGVDFPLEKLIDTIHQMQDMGNCYIGLTGGEPTLRDDLEDIVEAIGEKSHTILFTNGEKLTYERAKGLKERGLFSASVSLDHFTAEVHDKLRGYKGAFDIAVRAIKASNRAGLYTIAGVVPTREMINAGEIPTFYKYLRDIGVHEVRVLAPIPTGRLVGNKDARWCGKDEEKLMWDYHMKLNKDKNFPKISEFSYLESEGMLGCMTGTYHIFIENDGSITPCDMIPLEFGNVMEEGFETAYRRMADRFQVPRHQCYVRAAHALFKKGFDEEGKFPLSMEQAMEITRRVKNKRMPEFFKRLGLPPAVFEDEAGTDGGPAEKKRKMKKRKEKLDLKGLECPEPVWMTQEKIWDMDGGVLEVRVTGEEARDNVTQAAEVEGWTVKAEDLGKGEFLLVLTY